MRGFDFSDIGQTAFSQLHYDFLTAAPPFDGSNTDFIDNSRNAISDSDARRRAQIVIGGRQQALAMFELEFPLVKEAGIRGVAFYDMGMADDIISEDLFREDFGFGVRWFSPIGPLRFEWGFPLDRRTNEEGSEFHFAIGAPF